MDQEYKRILLKLSGEALAGDQQFGIEPVAIGQFAKEIAEVASTGLQIALVIGGGNIFRGMAASAKGMDRAQGDYMGMLATRVMTALQMADVAEPYIRRRALRHMDKGRVVICAAGTGNPYFTTDSAAALRALELKCDAIFKATKVDGVYDKDPAKFDDAVKYETVSYLKTLEKRLGVMDSTAISMARDNDLPIIVFNLYQEGNIRRAANGENIGTTVQGE